MAEDDDQRVPVYSLHPPSWLPRTASSGGLGYFGFYPPKPGQIEDQLTDTALKSGLTIPAQVSAETFTAHDILKFEGNTLAHIGALIDEVFARQVDSVPTVSQSTFRIPTRVTLNDAKRQAWFADLANPNVPLHKLGKSVPHGPKGPDLLDLLQSNNVAIPRAIWFLRVLGANETAGLRNKPGYNPTQYSIEWANVVTTYLKKQLAEIVLPSAARLGLNIKQTFKGVLSDADTRERWISRFTYCLRLLKTFYSEGLVDHRTFLVWIVHQMATCNLAQAGFVTRLADEYFGGIMGSHALARPLVDSCLAKLAEIKSSPAEEFLVDTEELLKTLLKRVCIAFPDAFVSPKMWKSHVQILTSVMEENILHVATAKHVQQNAMDIQDILKNNLMDIRRRNETMLFQCQPAQRSTRLGSAIEDIQLLNNISSTTALDELHFFPQSIHDQSVFVQKLDMLLTWAVTPYQYGEHRPFAAATILRSWRDEACDRASRREFGSPSEYLQDQLFDWLDTSEVAGDKDNLRATSLLFGKLVMHDLFSYSNYIQRLIARGEQLVQAEGVPESRHRLFLRSIPIIPATSSLINQRKVTLYGARAREIPEDLNEKEIRRELRLALPALFEGDSVSSPTTTPVLLECCKSLIRSPRYEQIRTIYLWLLPLLKRYIAGHEKQQPAVLEVYTVSLELMEQTDCYYSILELTLCVLEHASSLDVLIAVINTLYTYSTTWACMNEMGRIVTALERAYHVLKARGVQSRPLLSLLRELDGGRHLSMQSRYQIDSEITAFTMALQPGNDGIHMVPDLSPEILLLADDVESDAPSTLANSLWIKYRTSPHWAWKVWNSTFACFREVANRKSDGDERHSQAVRYGSFLRHVDQYLAAGLDEEVLNWLTVGPGKIELKTLTAEGWEVLITAVLNACVTGAIKTTTILEGFIYPAWLQALSPPSDSDDPYFISWLHSANRMFDKLILQEDVSEDLVSPINLTELQSIRSRRQEVFRSYSFPGLVYKIPVLLLIEKKDHVAVEVREEIANIRKNLCLKSHFRQAAYQNLDTVRAAFEQPLNEPSHGDEFNKQLMETLGLLFQNPGQDQDASEWPAFKSLLSPWKIAASMVEVQLGMKQLGRDLASGELGNWSASRALDKLCASLLQRGISRDEAFYIGEMMKGVDPLVVGKFLDNGIKHLADVLKTSTPEPSGRLQKAGDLLYALIYVAESTWSSTCAPSPELDPTKQSSFLNALLTYLPSPQATPGSTETNDGRFAIDLAIVLRLLQFQLGFGSSWNVEIKELSTKFANSLFKLALVHGISEDLVDPATYSMIIDTLYYLYDEIPCDPKITPYDPFRHYPTISVQELPAELPPLYRRQLLHFLPHFPTTAVVTNLINSHRDPNGNLVYGSQVVNQPWEWIENLGEVPPAEIKPTTSKGLGGASAPAQVDSRHEVKNSGSLPLQCFEAQVTGDSILRNVVNGENLRSFESGLTGEPIFQRDWRETRIDCEANPRVPSQAAKSPVEYDSSGNAYHLGMGRPERRSTPNLSPASTSSRTPTATRSGTSGRQSPASAVQRSAAKKRKVIEVTDDDNDDDVEIVEGPHPARPDAKKAKPRVASKTTVKKR